MRSLCFQERLRTHKVPSSLAAPRAHSIDRIRQPDAIVDRFINFDTVTPSVPLINRPERIRYVDWLRHSAPSLSTIIARPA